MQATSLQRSVLDWLWPRSGWPPLLLPAVLAVVQVVGTNFAAEDQPERRDLDALAVALLLAGPLLLIGRGRYPAATAFAVSGVTLTYLLFEYPYGPVFFSMVVALYNAVVNRHRLAAWLAAGLLYAGHFLARGVGLLDERSTLGEYLGVAAWLLVILIGSEVVRARRESALAAERELAEEERRVASEERLRIARELHDALAHHISLMNVQAGVALHLMDRQPEQARTALTAIEAASREALGELRSVLDILQRPEEAAPRRPAPGLANLDELTSRARAAGLEVETNVEGRSYALPGPVDAAAYRIIQEALTNVIRHAGASSVVVTLRYDDHDFQVRVEDNGSGARTTPSRGSGSGLTGMRQRVAALGGVFEAGPLPGRGFRVWASLPVGQA